LKTAILDSGVDTKHGIIRQYKPKIKNFRDWINNKNGQQDLQMMDNVGHGTHVAGLVLAVAKIAHLFIGKITDDNSLGDRDCVANAIQHAVKEWQVDIISLSFGFEDYVGSIRHAIANTDCVIFAAASNNGSNRKHAFPANQDGVIAIHSTSGQGAISSFNTQAISGEYNFSIVGEAVESAWPGLAPDGQPNMRIKSGTSFATPIAVGVTALIIEFLWKHLQEADRGLLKHSQTHGAITRILKVIFVEQGPYRYIAPWAGLERNTREEIVSKFVKTLRYGVS
ncbi:subtilisin-like protein, partial [Bimuria novae-zelandiae CBS 107.79]